MLKPGLTFTAQTVVSRTNTAASYGSGIVEVFATPAMVALMENAARNAVAEALPEGSTTVGTAVNITHTRATPLGEEVNATATLAAVDGRVLTFEVRAFDANGTVGQGTHTRYVVDAKHFMDKFKK